MNKSMMVWVGVSLVSALGCAGAEGFGDETEAIEAYASQGQAITGGIQTANDYAIEINGCSGTILNKHTILTAAHCFDFEASKKKTVKVYRTVSTSRGPGSFQYSRECVANVSKCKLTGKVLIHPDASSDPDDVAHDVALVITKQEMTLDTLEAPLLDITRSQDTGAYQVLSMGPISEQDTTAGLLRVAAVPIDKVTAGTIEGKIYTNDAVHICHGDSGAPVTFRTATVDGDTRTVVGAMVTQGDIDDSPGLIGRRGTTERQCTSKGYFYYTRTYANRSWIKKKAKGGCTKVSDGSTDFLDCMH